MQTISFYNLALSLLPLIIVWYYYKKWTNDKIEIIYSTARMVIQLVIIGYLLIFIFNTKNLYLGIFIIFFMLVVSTFIILRVTTNKDKKHYFKIFTSILISGLFHLLLISIFVLQLDPIYTPRYVIPIAGMIFANIMNALSLAIERFEKEIKREENYEKAREISFKACMIPQINSLLAVGVVALPGMMTGQILSGIDPLVAIRYQIMIMIMSISSSGIAAIIYFLLKEKKRTL